MTVVGLLATLYGMFQPHPTVANGQELPLVPVDKSSEQKNWDNYGNTAGGSRFVALDQITRDNVKDLKPVWTYRTGDIPESPTGSGAEDQQTPLQVGDRVFLCTPHNNVIALDADTGKQIWKTEINAQSQVWNRCRGLAYFDASKPLEQPTVPGSTPVKPVTLAAGDTCQRRILMNTIDARLVAINAENGEMCENFGDKGVVDLKAGLGDASDPKYQLTSAPTLAGTTVVVGAVWPTTCRLICLAAYCAALTLSPVKCAGRLTRAMKIRMRHWKRVKPTLAVRQTPGPPCLTTPG